MRSFIEKVKRMIFWAWEMRDSYDFDYGYTEKVILIKLQRLSHSMDTDSHHMNIKDIVEELKKPDLDESERLHFYKLIKCYKSLNLVIKILERRSSGSTYYDDISGITKFYDENPIDIENMFKISREKNSIYCGKLRAVLLVRDKLIDRDKKMLYNLISKHSDGWWT